MKSISILALAAGASATFNFNNFGGFTCPSNTDNQCTDKQSGGFTWDDLPTGGFSNYGGFNWKGWTCKDSFGKREAGRFAPRTGGKAISGVCGHDAGSSPSFGCDSSKSVDKFSLGEVHVKPEFDCDLEFHYDMPDGSKCKHRSSCSSKGSVVTNDQCGGATSVTIVYPSQTNKPKPTCSIEIPTISFSCGSASTTKPPKTRTTKATTTTSPAEVTTTSSAEEVTTTTSPAETSPVEETTSSPAVETTSSPAVETTTTSAEAETTSAPVSSVLFGNSTTSAPAVESTTTTSEEATTEVTSFLSTSTVFSTVVSTITSCAPTVTNCPAHSVTVTTVLVPVSTTICPVTETHTRKQHTTTASAVESSAPVSSTETSPGGPTETLPCPDVVPKCLSTWIFSTGCSDNSDASCYCPDELFVKNIFSCLYAYGETDTIVSEAVVFFQGICAPYIPGNPAIVTGAETVTTYITATATPTSTPGAVYTTITVDQTTVVPCTNTAGETIPSSSSTYVISTTLTVPQVGFTTAPSGGVGVVPVTSYTPVATSPAETGSGSGPETTIQTAAPVSSGVATGTGFFTPTPTPTQVTVSGGDKISARFGLAGLAVMALVAAL